MQLWLTAIIVLLLCTGITLSYEIHAEYDSSEYGSSPGKIMTNCSCGQRNPPKGRIVGGERAGKFEWPLIAEISILKIHICGASVVTKRHIITAAHCAYFAKSLTPLPVDKMVVFVGILEIMGPNAFREGQKFTVEQFTTHPDYHYINKGHDIAVVYLNSEITFNRKVGPVCLPLGTEQIMGQKLRVMGWGREYYDAMDDSPVLLQVDLDVVNHSECHRTYHHYNNETNICAQTIGKDACQGDSGGPLLWRDPDTNRYVLVAVTSYGRKCAVYPAVNSNIMYFLPWIQQVISSTNPSYTTCAKINSNENLKYYKQG